MVAPRAGGVDWNKQIGVDLGSLQRRPPRGGRGHQRSGGICGSGAEIWTDSLTGGAPINPLALINGHAAKGVGRL